jgi:hypothetical protein
MSRHSTWSRANVAKMLITLVVAAASLLSPVVLRAQGFSFSAAEANRAAETAQRDRELAGRFGMPCRGLRDQPRIVVTVGPAEGDFSRFGQLSEMLVARMKSAGLAAMTPDDMLKRHAGEEQAYLARIGDQELAKVAADFGRPLWIRGLVSADGNPSQMLGALQITAKAVVGVDRSDGTRLAQVEASATGLAGEDPTPMVRSLAREATEDAAAQSWALACGRL